MASLSTLATVLLAGSPHDPRPSPTPSFNRDAWDRIGETVSSAITTAAAVGLALILAMLGAALFGAGVVVGGGSRPRATDKEVRITAAVATGLSVLAVVCLATGAQGVVWTVYMGGL